MASIGQSITGPRFYEMDEVCDSGLGINHTTEFLQWFDRQKTYLDSLESQLKGLVKAIEVVAKHRAGSCLFSLARSAENRLPRASHRHGRVRADSRGSVVLGSRKTVIPLPGFFSRHRTEGSGYSKCPVSTRHGHLNEHR
jgi:hypothetical protein